MRLVVPALLLSLTAACAPDRSDYQAGGGGDGGSSSGGTTASGLPCDVAQVLQNQCITCHGATPIGGAPMPLVTYADLTAKSTLYPGQTYAQRSVVRMQDANLPMPPGGGASAADIQTLQNWINSGMPQGSCGGDSTDGGTASTGGEVPDSPPQCTSNSYWTRGNRGSSLMHPGKACIDCHSSGEGPWYSAAGTVFPTTHEPDDCNGQGGVTVTITDHGGHTYTATSNSAGNFYFRSSFQYPITAEVSSNGKTRKMLTPQSSGDCNLCHTQNGLQAAPGRVVAP